MSKPQPSRRFTLTMQHFQIPLGNYISKHLSLSPNYLLNGPQILKHTLTVTHLGMILLKQSRDKFRKVMRNGGVAITRHPNSLTHSASLTIYPGPASLMLRL
jgi:hypothetical protein